MKILQHERDEVWKKWEAVKIEKEMKEEADRRREEAKRKEQ